jgi:chromosome segregation ATPase
MCSGAEVPVFDGTAAPAGQEGLEYLCSKYSSLIARLRQEVLARQQAEGEARLYEHRFREEVSLRQADQHQWEEERRSLRDEILALRSLQRELEEARNAEALQLQTASATSRQLSARCDQLHEACAEEAQKTLQVIDKAAVGGEVLIRQGEELTRLRREHTDAITRCRDTSDELATCRDHLAKWRRTAGDLEGKLEAVTCAREAAESRSRHLQDEMRQALRSASAAKAREAATASNAGRGQRELRSRGARLSVVRKEGQRFAQRASSAEHRLRAVEGYEVVAERLAKENRELYLRLEAEARLVETTRTDMARAEAGEARASASAGECQSELRAKDTLSAATRQRIAELEGELSHARTRLEQLEGERTASAGSMEGLRTELKQLRDEREETRRDRDKASIDLAESRRRVDRGTPQLAECRRRLQHAEDSLAKAHTEAAEERKARERCHNEAIRAGEKLRLARSQNGQLRDRVRTLEQLDLRYPSRLRNLETEPITGGGNLAPSTSATGGIGALEAALPLTPSPPPSPRCFSHPSACIRHDSPLLGAAGRLAGEGDMDVREFVEREEQRLTAMAVGAAAKVDCLCRGTVGESSVLEEPRTTLPAQAIAPSLQRAAAAAAQVGNPTTASSTIAGLRHFTAASPTGAAVVGADEGELAALLAAEPRVLKLPEPVQLAQAEKPQAQGDSWYNYHS